MIFSLVQFMRTIILIGTQAEILRVTAVRDADNSTIMHSAITTALFL